MTVYNAEGWYAAMERGEVRAGDLVTGDVVMDAMNALPPVRMSTSCAQMGEPYAHAVDDNGRYRPLFWTWRFESKPDAIGCDTWGEMALWEFCGACFARETANREVNYEPGRMETASCA